jgi:hypothetical protein
MLTVILMKKVKQMQMAMLNDWQMLKVKRRHLVRLIYWLTKTD